MATKSLEEVELPALCADSRNIHKVPKKQWAKWPRVARRVFNAVFRQMTDSQFAFLHPKSQPVAADQWKTVAWNAAWTAADAVTEGWSA